MSHIPWTELRDYHSPALLSDTCLSRVSVMWLVVYYPMVIEWPFRGFLSIVFYCRDEYRFSELVQGKTKGKSEPSSPSLRFTLQNTGCGNGTLYPLFIFPQAIVLMFSSNARKPTNRVSWKQNMLLYIKSLTIGPTILQSCRQID